MHNFLHQQCQGMNPPTLLDWIEVDEVNANTPTLLKRMQVNNRERRILLDRLETSDDTPLSFPKMMRTEPALLDRFMMGMEENPIMSTGMNHLTLTGTQGMETILKVNQLNKWTTSPKTSDKTMSQNLEHFQPLYWFSMSTHPHLNEQRIQQSNIMERPSMKLKPSLFQHLGEENLLNKHYSKVEGVPNQFMLPETLVRTPTLMNSFCRSVGNQRTPISTDPQTRSKESMNLKCHGLSKRRKPDEMVTKIAKNHAESSNSSLEIIKSLSNGYKPPELLLWDSQQVSGTTSSEGNLLTLTQCCHHCTIFPLLRRTLDKWDILKSPLEGQNQLKRSKRAANGPALGTPPSKRQNSLSLTKIKSLGNMENTLRGISQPRSHPHTGRSSYMIAQSKMKLGEARTLYSQTPIAPQGSIQPSSCPMESNPTMLGSHPSMQLERSTQRQKFATASTLPTVAETYLTTAVSDMPASSASKWVMGKNLAMSKKLLTHELHPKYLRYNIWDSGEHFSRSSADWTETASVLPTIPTSELKNPIITKTINKNPHLFDIVTHFVDWFKELLESHPNQHFVKSVCCGLWEGFWPCADTHIGEYPDTLNSSLPEPDNPDEAQFLQDQRDHKVFMGCFSEPFGDKLLPGMYCMPIFAVPKPHSADLWMVTDQSVGKFSLNSMIPREDIISYPLDNLQHLGEFLLLMHHQSPDSPHIPYKSDVSEAYRLLPVHPYWQIKQMNWIGGSLHVDRNNAFGGRASGCNWIAFMALVLQIAKKKQNIEFLGTYSDDSFGLDHADNLATISQIHAQKSS